MMAFAVPPNNTCHMVFAIRMLATAAIPGEFYNPHQKSLVFKGLSIIESCKTLNQLTSPARPSVGLLFLASQFYYRNPWF